MPEQHLEFYQHFYTENLFLIPDLHSTAPTKDSLSTATEEINGDTQPVKKYNLLGENKKGLIIVVALPEKEFRALPQHEFLSKVLASIRHTPEDVAFINLASKEKLDTYKLSKETTVNQLLAFGPGLLDLDVNSKISLYKPASIGATPLLIADVLGDIENDVNKKKLLWNGLQTIFLR